MSIALELLSLPTAAEVEAVRLSLGVAFKSMALVVPVAIPTAWLLSRGQFWGKAFLDALVHVSLVLPPVVVGYLLLVVLGVHGPIGSWLDRVWGVRLAFTSTGAAVACAVMSFPLVVRVIRLSLDSIDPGLEQAARTLGAGPFDRFVTIALPLMLPGILSGAVIAFAAALGEFGAVITFAASIPGETQTLPLAIYAALQTPGGDGTAARLALISFSLALTGLLISESIARRARAWLLT